MLSNINGDYVAGLEAISLIGGEFQPSGDVYPRGRLTKIVLHPFGPL